jgi:hypothetical protein
MRQIIAHATNAQTPSAMDKGGKSPFPDHLTFSQELEQLAKAFSDRSTRVSEILKATKGRGFNLLLVCVSLPFVTPIPLPGLSIPFGLVVALVGARLATGHKPWLPQRFLSKELPPRFLSKLLKTASWVVRLLEIGLRPRLAFLHESLVLRRAAGTLVMLSGLFLILPLPLPFSNSLPAWTVLLIAAGALERDGAAFLAGCFMFVVTASYFGLLALGGAHAVDGIKHAILGAWSL